MAPQDPPDEHDPPDPPDGLDRPEGAALEPRRPGSLATEAAQGEALGPGGSALPGVGVRLLAFASIVVAGVCGGLIGWSVTDLQCTAGCTGLAAGVGVASAVGAALGVAIVAVLVLRAMGEWNASPQRGAPMRNGQAAQPRRAIRR
ncbi:MAG: hypothetical protein ACKVWR_02235 [Acidimicrobiales bacterium]